MGMVLDHEQAVALGLCRLRELLAEYVERPAQDSDAWNFHVAARLVDAVHEQACAVLEGRSYDTAKTLAAFGNIDKDCGTNLIESFLKFTHGNKGNA